MRVLFTRERLGLRSRWITFVWYPRRGHIEAWLGRLGAMRFGGQWFFTRTGNFIFGGGMSA